MAAKIHTSLLGRTVQAIPIERNLHCRRDLPKGTGEIVNVYQDGGEIKIDVHWQECGAIKDYWATTIGALLDLVEVAS